MTPAGATTPVSTTTTPVPVSVAQAQQSSTFPVKNRVTQLKTGPHLTHIVVQQYSNTVFAVVSQFRGQPGTLIEFKSDHLVQLGGNYSVATGGGAGGEDSNSSVNVGTSFDYSVLFGVETPQILLAARVLAQTLYDHIVIAQNHNSNQTILISLALKDTSKSTLTLISQAIKDIALQS